MQDQLFRVSADREEDMIGAATSEAVVVQGQAVEKLIADHEFACAWTELHSHCPWATPCQSWAFANIWLSVYADQYEPLFVVQHDHVGRLIGLLPLAVERTSGRVFHVGATQAEYQVWLARESSGDSFMEAACDALHAAVPGRTITLKYLPAGTPLSWTRGRSRGHFRTVLETRRRPLMSLGEGNTVEQSLRKKSNRSRINRLNRRAPLALERLRDRPSLDALIDRIADFCDLRQGAVNETLPFRDDPFKKEFHLRMMEEPGLLHASALMSGDDLVAANLGLDSGSFVTVGVLVHSPFMAEHSPGKMLMLLLAQQLRNEGYSELDLTPGADPYKERFADHGEEVNILSVHLDLKSYLRHATLARAKRHVKRLPPAWQDTARNLLVHRSRLTPRAIAGRALAAIRRVPHDEPVLAAATDESLLRRDCVSDILSYRPSGAALPTRTQFLRMAADRYEDGQHSLSYAQDGILMDCRWIEREHPADGGP